MIKEWKWQGDKQPETKEEIKEAIEENRRLLGLTTQRLVEAAADAANHGCYKNQWPQKIADIAVASGASPRQVDKAIQDAQPHLNRQTGRFEFKS